MAYNDQAHREPDFRRSGELFVCSMFRSAPEDWNRIILFLQYIQDVPFTQLPQLEKLDGRPEVSVIPIGLNPANAGKW